MKTAVRFPIMFASIMFIVNAACTTKPLVYTLGEPEVAVKSAAWAATSESEWTGLQDKACITHLYSCDLNDQGMVTAVKALHLSHPAFHALTEEAIRTWKFVPGKSGQCYVDYVYTPDGEVRIVLLGPDHAQSVASKRAQDTQPSAAVPQMVSSVKRVMPEFPRIALLGGKMGMVRAQLDVNPEGIPENIRIIQSMPDQQFDKPTRSALNRWRYKTLAEQPDARRTNIEVSFYFNLDGKLGYDCELRY